MTKMLQYNIQNQMNFMKVVRKTEKSQKKPTVLENHTRSKLLRVKFILSKDNISCFIKDKQTANKSLTTSSIVKNKSHKAKSKESLEKDPRQRKSKHKESRGRENSLEMIKSSSNTVLKNIEENGINFDWKEIQSCSDKLEEQMETDDDLSLWSGFPDSIPSNFHDYSFSQPAYQAYTMRQPLSFTIYPASILEDWRTTIMIRNIPNKYTINELSAQIDSEHENTYDFLYLPCDLKNQCNVGYGFINFISTSHMTSFYQKFQQYVWKKYRSQKICALTYARLQGLSELIEHFENSKVLNMKEKKFRPIIKYEQIERMVMRQQGR